MGCTYFTGDVVETYEGSQGIVVAISDEMITIRMNGSGALHQYHYSNLYTPSGN
jgi:preprotein translocase subunit YajC